LPELNYAVLQICIITMAGNENRAIVSTLSELNHDTVTLWPRAVSGNSLLITLDTVSRFAYLRALYNTRRWIMISQRIFDIVKRTLINVFFFGLSLSPLIRTYTRYYHIPAHLRFSLFPTNDSPPPPRNLRYCSTPFAISRSKQPPGPAAPLEIDDFIFLSTDEYWRTRALSNIEQRLTNERLRV